MADTKAYGVASLSGQLDVWMTPAQVRELHKQLGAALEKADDDNSMFIVRTEAEADTGRGFGTMEFRAMLVDPEEDVFSIEVDTED